MTKLHLSHLCSQFHRRAQTACLPVIAAVLLAPAAVDAGTEKSDKKKQEREMTAVMKEVTKNGVGRTFGEVKITETQEGLVFSPDLEGLSSGLHGFHVHENPSCDPQEKDGKLVPGGAAGSHFDPQGAEHHGAPWGEGHLGDLPALHVASDGNANHPVLAPRLKLKQLKDRSLVIHANGDNYSDDPNPLGGGGSRVACGVIK